MATVHTRIESARGCGFRKAGGCYLVIDGKGIQCQFLPVDLPEEIKTSRGGQWRLAEIAIGKKAKRVCRNPGKKCSKCWIIKMDDKETCLILFVGTKFYKTTKHFDAEAGRLGISRRIPQRLISKIEVGKTPVLLAHRKSYQSVNEEGEVFTTRQVFAAFVPSRIEYIVTGKESAEELDQLQAKGLTLIKVIKAGKVLDLGIQSN